VDPAANALVDKCSAESFATVSALTAAASGDPTVRGHRLSIWCGSRTGPGALAATIGG
jgi:hypothetical protein